LISLADPLLGHLNFTYAVFRALSRALSIVYASRWPGRQYAILLFAYNFSSVLCRIADTLEEALKLLSPMSQRR
jgi:hypothetical protein